MVRPEGIQTPSTFSARASHPRARRKTADSYLAKTHGNVGNIKIANVATAKKRAITFTPKYSLSDLL
jgi:hypothetical protein